jgi:hypothetical protein
MIETVSIDVDLIVGGYGAVDFLLRPLVPNWPGGGGRAHTVQYV